MNALDIILVAPLVWGIYKGYKKGLILEVATLIALILGIWGAIHFSNWTYIYLSQWLTLEDSILKIISFAITFVLIILGVHLLGKAIEKIVSMVSLNFVNKFTGAIFGLTKYALILGTCLYVVEMVNENIEFVPENTRENSILYNPSIDMIEKTIPSIKSLWDQHYPSAKTPLDSASTPGSTLPSRYSSIAPPPVEI